MGARQPPRVGRPGPLGRLGVWVTAHARTTTVVWLLLIVGLTTGINLNPFSERMATLPVFAYSQFANPGARGFGFDRAWTAALVLMIIVMLLNLVARLVSYVFSPKGVEDDALLHPDTRAHYRALLAQGWTDAVRHLHPAERIYTFWDYFRNAYGRDAGLRIDHLLLSPALADRLVDAQVDRHVRGWEKTSDHAPVWVELGDKPKRKRQARSANQSA